jgi:hypothetical protein
MNEMIMIIDVYFFCGALTSIRSIRKKGGKEDNWMSNEVN